MAAPLWPVAAQPGSMSTEVLAMVRVLHDKQQAVIALCARFGVERLDVFGSALRDDFRPGE